MLLEVEGYAGRRYATTMVQSKLEEHRGTLQAVLPFVAIIALLLVGLWMRWPNVGYDGPATQRAYNQFAFDHFAYSDIASLYFRDGLWADPRPYFDYPLEYPVGLGFLTYLLNLTTSNMPQYFLLTSLEMMIAAFLIAALVPRFPRGRLLLFALSPALALYVNLNWDMWGVFLMVAALLLFVQGRDGWGAVVLTAAVWTKFFPILFLPFLVLDRLRRDGKWAAGRIVAIFAVLSAAINLPVLLLSPAGWWYFFAFNAARGRDWNLWILLDPLGLSTDGINRVSALLMLWGLVALLLLQWRLPSSAYGLSPTWLPACCAMLAWFFFVNKDYSPQYGLWIVVLLAVLGAAPVLVVAWSAVDLLYFACGFIWLELWKYSGDAQQWFGHYIFLPATALREMMLLVVAGWCVKQMSASAREPVQDSDEQPQGSPAGVA